MTTFQNLFTGLSEGSFDKLHIRDSSGSLVDILTLIGGGSGGGSGSGLVTSAAAPLEIDNNGRISLDEFTQLYLKDQGGQVHTLDIVGGNLRLDGSAIAETADLTGFLTQSDLTGLQPLLSQGAGISIQNNVISATGGSGSSYIVSVSAPLSRDAQGDLSIVPNTFYTRTEADALFSSQTATSQGLATKQPTLTASNFDPSGLSWNASTQVLSNTHNLGNYFTKSEVLSSRYTKNATDGLLAQKQPTLSSANAGSGISISVVAGAVVIANTAQGGSGGSGTALGVQLDGTATSVSALNFQNREVSLSQGILSIRESTCQPQLSLYYGSSTATKKALTQNAATQLVWGTDAMATESHVSSSLQSKQNTLVAGNSISFTGTNGTTINGPIYTAVQPLSVTTTPGVLGGDLELATTHPMQVQNGALELDQTWLGNNYVSTTSLSTTLQGFQPKLTQASHASTNIEISASGAIGTTHKLQLKELNNNTTGDLERAANGDLLYATDPVALRPWVALGYEPKLATGNFSSDFSYNATTRHLSLTNSIPTPLTLQVNGVTQTGVHTLDLGNRVFTNTSGVLTIDRRVHYDKIALTSQTGPRDLTASGAGTLLWDSNDLATQLWVGQNHQALLVQNNFDTGLAWDNATQKLSLTGGEERTVLKLKDPSNNPYHFQLNSSGELERHDPTSVPSFRRNYDSEIAGKQASFSAARPLNFTASQSGFSVLESLWKPTNFQASQADGFVIDKADDNTGELVLKMSGQEYREYLRLLQSGSTSLVNVLSASTTDELLWTNSSGAVYNISSLPASIAAKLTIPTQSAPFTTTNAGPQLFMRDITDTVTNAFILSQSSGGTYDLNWGSNSSFKSYTYLKNNHLDKIENAHTPTHHGGFTLGVAGQANNSYAHLIEAYGIPSNGTFSYSMGLRINPSSSHGLGFYVSQGDKPDLGYSNFTGAGTVLPQMFVTRYNTAPTGTAVWQDRVGIGGIINPQHRLDLGTSSAATIRAYSISLSIKPFEIPHPDPVKAADSWKLRHWCQESDDVGGSVAYRRIIDASQGNNVIVMPEWFPLLTKNVICFSSPIRHFGLSWADQNPDNPREIILGASKAGRYAVMITAARNDEATRMCPSDVEYQEFETFCEQPPMQ